MSTAGDQVLILAIPGSLRRDSYNRLLLEAAAQLAPPGARIEVFNGLESVPVFNVDLEDAPDGPPEVIRLRDAVAATNGLLISTPEYNQSVPGVVKNLIDWLSRGEPHQGLAGRPVAITGATTGPWGTRISQTLLRQMLHSTQALVMPAPTLYVARVESLIDSEGQLANREVLTGLADLVSSFVDWIRLVGSTDTGDQARWAGPIHARVPL